VDYVINPAKIEAFERFAKDRIGLVEGGWRCSDFDHSNQRLASG
jgi:hypothetical protein